MEPNWDELNFDFNATGGENLRYYFRDGAWSDAEYTTSEYIPVHMCAACLNYGLQAFEGLKAFRGVDGRVRLFRPHAHYARMAAGARKLCLPMPSEQMFVDACVDIVRRNLAFLPPYESRAALYVRPVLFGTKPCLTVRGSNEAGFCVFATPVGPYFKEGIHPINAIVNRNQDRSAPLGTGDVKVGGNYASSMLSCEEAHAQGFKAVLYTESIEHRYIEECGAANFIAIRGKRYITPKSPSILPSITNASLRQIAMDKGFTVEERQVDVAELDSFDECGACGTGAIITPLGNVYDPDMGKTIHYGDDVGPVLLDLYHSLQDIQYGRAEDKYGWCIIVE
ncbi:MAG: branched-chain amino acid aminotransferase [Alistipes sp.]|nr:branched-chain amino acid aminotransferase [Alistipes sp.]